METHKYILIVLILLAAIVPITAQKKNTLNRRARITFPPIYLK